jgi:hypothetical protein
MNLLVELELLMINLLLGALFWITFFTILPERSERYAKFTNIEPLPIWWSAIDGAFLGLLLYVLNYLLAH